MPSWGGNRLPWDLSVILLQVPSASGVYAIWRDRVCIYVGDTQDLLSRLLTQYRGIDPRITREQPTFFGFELLTGVERVTRRESLIAELRPVFSPAP
jgi:hypothetical protein